MAAIQFLPFDGGNALMKYVLYGVLRAGEDVEHRLPALTDSRIRLPDCERRLGGRHLRQPAESSGPEERHAEIVQMLHEVCTVLPMRCGIGFQTEAEVRASWFRTTQREFRAALAALQGCAEGMGPPVLCSVTAASPPTPARQSRFRAPGPTWHLGRLYYAGQDARRRELLHVAGDS